MKIFKGIAGVLFFFALGYYLHTQTTNYIDNSPRRAAKVGRDPAAIKRVYDFSHLDGSALRSASQQRLIDGVKVIRDQDKDLGIELGHFVLKGAEGNKEFACQQFERITLVFEGEGVAIAGSLPSMEIEGRCEIDQDINKISAIWIPVSRIIGEPVAEGEFDFRDQKNVRVRFTNVSDFWPKLWQLKSIKLEDLDGAVAEMRIEPSEIRELSRRPLLIEFPQ